MNLFTKSTILAGGMLVASGAGAALVATETFSDDEAGHGGVFSWGLENNANNSVLILPWLNEPTDNISAYELTGFTIEAGDNNTPGAIDNVLNTTLGTLFGCDNPPGLCVTRKSEAMVQFNVGGFSQAFNTISTSDTPVADGTDLQPLETSIDLVGFSITISASTDFSFRFFETLLNNEGGGKDVAYTSPMTISVFGNPIFDTPVPAPTPLWLLLAGIIPMMRKKS